MTLKAALATHRFGLGAKPGEIDAIGGDAEDWLLNQLGPAPAPAIFERLPGAAELVGSAPIMRTIPKKDRKTTNRMLVQRALALFSEEVALRYAHAFVTGQGFRERLVRFWSNHFTVSVSNNAARGLVGAFEREAIRPHLAGRFEDMLLAAARHPAMLIYLDNAHSVGPNSVAGRKLEKGLNENLAREILELHTLGVTGGYTQDDVVALAKILTGWAVARGKRDRTPDGFRYIARRHEPGAHRLLGRSYPETGNEGQGLRALRDLAEHPSTARHIATKLARHFFADDPPADMVQRLEAVFRKTGGSLDAVHRALVSDPAAFSSELVKFRQPEEFVVASIRALQGPKHWGAKLMVAAAGKFEEQFRAADGDMDKLRMQRQELRKSKDPALALLFTIRALGQFPFTAPSPAGWADDAGTWAGPDAVIERLEWANALASRLPIRTAPGPLAEAVLGPLASERTRAVLAGAASAAQGTALLFASPEFQRR